MAGCCLGKFDEERDAGVCGYGEAATKRLDALAHATDPERGRLAKVFFRQANAIVANLQYEGMVVRGELYRNSRCLGMARDIRERLLKDSEERQRDIAEAINSLKSAVCT